MPVSPGFAATILSNTAKEETDGTTVSALAAIVNPVTNVIIIGFWHPRTWTLWAPPTTDTPHAAESGTKAKGEG